ncbi:hypothetical protein C8R43DRAFT_1236451 [Mycena crocata]|nr:hypothetical protein C8R43DRAFT_1236451 [Mycena crocata]
MLLANALSLVHACCMSTQTSHYAGTTNPESIPKSTQGYGSEDDCKLEYMDEWEPLPPLGSVEHDDVDCEIERAGHHISFPTICIVISTPAPAVQPFSPAA